MRKATLIGVVVLAGVAIGAYRLSRSNVAPVAESAISSKQTAPEPAEQPRVASPVAPPSAVETPAATVAIFADSGEVAADTGHDDHSHEQEDPRPLEAPPPAREAFGADPASDSAALAEARAILEGLLEEPDPALRAEVTALLETIEAAE
jgi:hypothetical protein